MAPDGSQHSSRPDRPCKGLFRLPVMVAGECGDRTMTTSTMARVAIVYHSRSGHTAAIAEHVRHGAASIEGVEVPVMDVAEGFPPLGTSPCQSRHHLWLSDPFWRRVGRDEGVSRRNRYLLAADALARQARGRLHFRGEPSGDKLTVLQQLVIFAGQHGMIWIGVDPMKDRASASRRPRDYNRQGGYIGAMADADGGVVGPDSPPASDRTTAECLGRRVAMLALTWHPPAWT